MDAKVTISTEQEGNGFFVAQFKTTDLAIFSYYVQSGSEVALIDPTFDVQVYKDLLDKRKAKLKYVVLTHYHADYLSGHTQFEVPIIMGPTAKKNVNKFDVQEQEDGSSIQLGQIKIKVIHTPGHTPESTSYLLSDSASKPQCLFSGDTVFLGDVGRPDLAVKAEGTVEDQAGILYESVQTLKKLDGHIRIYPGHGSGSACGKAIGSGNFCNIETQKEKNYGFKFDDKGEFIKAVTAQLPKPPQYFSHDVATNQSGAGRFQQVLQKANRPLSVQEFKSLMEKIPVIDTRNDAESLIRGKVYWLPAKGQMVNWLANILSPQDQFILFTEKGQWKELAQRCFRIGYFNIRGYNDFTMQEWKGEAWKPKIVKFQHFKGLKDQRHLDVRGIPEFEQTGAIQNSICIPLPDLPKRVAELKGEKNLLVSCRTGMRARVAMSILAQQGIEGAVFVEPFDKFAAEGLKIVPFKKE